MGSILVRDRVLGSMDQKLQKPKIQRFDPPRLPSSRSTYTARPPLSALPRTLPQQPMMAPRPVQQHFSLATHSLAPIVAALLCTRSLARRCSRRAVVVLVQSTLGRTRMVRRWVRKAPMSCRRRWSAMPPTRRVRVHVIATVSFFSSAARSVIYSS